MRLIDADALISIIQEDKIEGKTLDIIKALGDGLQAETLNQSCDRHIKIISNLPTIDAVPVVRCKDCKRWKDSNDGECPYHLTGDPYIDDDPEEDFFCAYGERKDDEGS